MLFARISKKIEMANHKMSKNKYEERATFWNRRELSVYSVLPQPIEECIRRDSFSGAIEMHQVTETLI
jgi:hypothetical protein